MRRFGFVVNPIAGMGGRVGLKGTDGKVEEARELGAEPRAPDRAREMLDELRDVVDEHRDVTDDVELVTYGGLMGETEAREAGFEPTVVGAPGDADSGEASIAGRDGEASVDSRDEETNAADSEEGSADSEETSAADTRAAVRAFLDHDVELILFVGGDGTAVDVAETLDECDADIPILGVPAGVKVYSAVFAVTPEAAAHVAVSFDSTERAEVNDIDEDQYREGEVHTELRALATVPVAEQRQSSKQLSAGTVEGVADRFAEEVEPGVTYVLGPGSTVGSIKEKLGFRGTPLGVDVYRDGEVVVEDAAESDILDALGEKNVIVVTPIGGQGFVFGRGNQQISPAVIRRSEVELVASRRKLDNLGVLRVDTGDSDLDEVLRGWHRVRVGRYETRLMEVV